MMPNFWVEATKMMIIVPLVAYYTAYVLYDTVYAVNNK